MCLVKVHPCGQKDAKKMYYIRDRLDYFLILEQIYNENPGVWKSLNELERSMKKFLWHLTLGLGNAEVYRYKAIHGWGRLVPTRKGKYVTYWAKRARSKMNTRMCNKWRYKKIYGPYSQPIDTSFVEI